MSPRDAQLCLPSVDKGKLPHPHRFTWALGGWGPHSGPHVARQAPYLLSYPNLTRKLSPSLSLPIPSSPPPSPFFSSGPSGYLTPSLPSPQLFPNVEPAQLSLFLPHSSQSGHKGALSGPFPEGFKETGTPRAVSSINGMLREVRLWVCVL